jgi:hypothetical protein
MLSETQKKHVHECLGKHEPNASAALCACTLCMLCKLRSLRMFTTWDHMRVMNNHNSASLQARLIKAVDPSCYEMDQVRRNGRHGQELYS